LSPSARAILCTFSLPIDDDAAGRRYAFAHAPSGGRWVRGWPLAVVLDSSVQHCSRSAARRRRPPPCVMPSAASSRCTACSCGDVYVSATRFPPTCPVALAAPAVPCTHSGVTRGLHGAISHRRAVVAQWLRACVGMYNQSFAVCVCVCVCVCACRVCVAWCVWCMLSCLCRAVHGACVSCLQSYLLCVRVLVVHVAGMSRDALARRCRVRRALLSPARGRAFLSIRAAASTCPLCDATSVAPELDLSLPVESGGAR